MTTTRRIAGWLPRGLAAATSTPRNCSALAQDNTGCLQQAVRLLEGLDDAAYVHGPADLAANGIGPHLRHCLDHYERLLAGLDDRCIDYDARCRDRRIETDRTFAIAKLRDVAAGLNALAGAPLETPVHIKMDGGGDGGAPCWSASSLGRELQFLVSHTVHHYAIMALILRRQGIDPGAEFGVAPSTLRHQRAMLPGER